MANLAQVALCTADLPRTIRTFVDVLGFRNAGGRPRWGEYASRVHELPTGDDTYVMMWWLVGRQEFVQIELFHHTSPAQRPRRPGWRPSDLGWVRFGVTVPDFDLTMRRLHGAGLTTMTSPVDVDGRRRVCVREPGADAIVEIMEETVGSHAPALAYVAASVSDLEGARRYFGEVFGFPEIQSDAIHRPEHEAMWGLDGARRACAVFRAGDVLLEVMHYETPRPKAPAADALLSDQGIMNVAIGHRDRAEMLDALAAAESLGASTTTDPPPVSGATYLRISDRLSVELLLVPPDLDGAYGFSPQDLAPPGSAFAPEVAASLMARDSDRPRRDRE
ncbi:VOC family protein [Acrocarpospora macrocephala]|uniref:VOC family protein n=1 Tax=Acrocarpospora macrocephala TaxID=150177 RepID=UPI001478BBCA|nr:VOC family protein [Acrocarpospora macrocephala]